MPQRSPARNQILSLLAEAPVRLDASTAGLSAAQLSAAPSPDEWSANTVLAHLRSCADVWGSCMMTIIAQDAPTIRAVNPRQWIKNTDYLEQEFQPSLRAFAVQRSELLAVLESLAPEDWLRAAKVTGAGKPLTRTVLDYVERLSSHEHTHVKQIEHIANALRK